MGGDMNPIKRDAIIEMSAVPYADGLRILDPGFTYWSDKGDCSRDEHLEFLNSAPKEQIAAWLKVVWVEEQEMARIDAKDTNE